MSSKEQDINNNNNNYINYSTKKIYRRKDEKRISHKRIINESSQIKIRRAEINKDKSAIKAFINSFEDYRKVTDKFASKHRNVAQILTEKLSLIEKILGALRLLLRELTKQWYTSWLSQNYVKRVSKTQESSELIISLLDDLQRWNDKTKKICPSHPKNYSCLICLSSNEKLKSIMVQRLNQRLKLDENYVGRSTGGRE